MDNLQNDQWLFMNICIFLIGFTIQVRSSFYDYLLFIIVIGFVLTGSPVIFFKPFGASVLLNMKNTLEALVRYNYIGNDTPHQILKNSIPDEPLGIA